MKKLGLVRLGIIGGVLIGRMWRLRCAEGLYKVIRWYLGYRLHRDPNQRDNHCQGARM